MKPKYILLITLLCLAFQVFPQGSSDSFAIEDSLVANTDIFDQVEPACITLKYDMKEFRKLQSEEKYLEAELIYHMSDNGNDQHRIVRIMARGKNRQEVCTFPPIWINIRESEKENIHLEGTVKMKLVTHCGNAGNFQTYVLKEYLAYQIYSLISPYSFRVRLVQMKYIDSSRKNKELDRWAFLIEPEVMLAERLDMMPLKSDRVSMQQTDTVMTNTMAMFQYMIGNSDYSISGRHNVKLLRDKDPMNFNLIPVPYDFDYSGLINAHYAIPGETLGLNSVRERYYLGPCRNPMDYKIAIDKLVAEKERMMDLINDFEHLSQVERTSMISYLEEFFAVSGESKFIERQISSTCR